MSSAQKPVYVTQPFLPDLEELIPFLRQIWKTRNVTNGGEFHQRFETAVADYLGVKHLSLFSNGMQALLVALHSLHLDGEVITTPFSFVATGHALLWNHVRPVFADIDPETFNLDPKKIEQAITPNTKAILAVHVYGRPCNAGEIERIAKLFGLRVIYDAAHAFGVRYRGQTVLAHGDFSILSFHATKVFNTFEGGAVISPNAETKKKVDDLKNFGFADEVSVVAVGINAKMNEFQAALGLVQLDHVDKAIARRKEIHARYEAALAGCRGITVPKAMAGTESNYAYFPILVGPDYRMSRDALYAHLREQKIFVRRYFFPLISDFPMYRELPSSAPEKLPVAQGVASQVLCLPIYPALSDDDIDRVVGHIR